jgi:uncharacterized protein
MNMGFPHGVLALSRLAAAPVEWSGRLAADLATWDLGGLRFARDPYAELKIESLGAAGARVTGQLTAGVEQECRRCLAPVVSEVDIPLDLRFDPEIEVEDEADGLYALDPGADELDLLPALREELLLALPDFPVCREDCRGLCSICGADRNESPCDCRSDEIDPRWEVLKEQFRTEPGAAEGTGDGMNDG